MGTAKTMKLSGDKLLHRRQAEQQQVVPVAGDVEQTTAKVERARQERMQALQLMFGAWKGRTDIPNDGLVFQNQLRSE